MEEEKSCNLNGPNDPNCGNCEYSQGNLCGKAPTNVNMKFGEFSCNDLSCKDLTTNPASPDSFGEKETGESWCLYDARVGFGQDVVGSRHYRSLCLNGEEVVEPCKDYREEICIQGVSGAIPNFNLGQAFNVGEGYLESACRTNRFQECNSCNSLNNEKDRQECCNDIENKDCFYMPGGVSDFAGQCVPMVPPGLRFWEGGTKGGSSEGTQTGADAVCNEGSTSCTVKWVRGGTARFGIGGVGTSTDWECVENCHCLTEDWVRAAATQCKARGDCGAKFNVAGKFTSGGISEDTDFTLDINDFESWNTISKQSTQKDDPTSMGEFWKRTWPSFLVIAGTGAAAGIYTATFGIGTGSAVSAIGSGFFLGPKTFLTLGDAATIEGTFVEAFRTGVSIPSRTTVTTLPSGELLFTESALKFPNGASRIIPQATESGTQWLFTDSAGKVLTDASGKALVATEAQVTAATEAFTSGFATFAIALLEVINVLAWIYTIYTLVDYFGKEDKKETFTVTCNAWTAPKGGSDCEKCNEEGKECSEYRCRSLGKLCRLINEGTEDEKCAAQTPLDSNSPRISAVKPKNLDIEERRNEGFIVKTLIKPFTPVELSVSTDEPSKCKFDLSAGIKYEEMKFNFGENLFGYNHTMLFSLPSELQSEQAVRLTNGGKYNLYLRCTDNNDNANERDYYINFEIDKGPDLTSPKIELTSIRNRGFVSNEKTEVGLDIFVNEPSECRWDKNDVDFELMKEKFICTNSGLNSVHVKQGLYRCGTLLKGLVKGTNAFYFRCKDKPLKNELRNVNEDSYKFELIKTEKLNIVSVEPKGKVFRANPKINVKTSVGAENGISICGYSTNKNAIISNIPLFAKTNSTDHEQQLRNLRKGNYNYYITCVDRAGNIDNEALQFEIAADVSQPVISYVYKDVRNNVLVIGTNEDSSCYYDTKQFSFGEGIPMTDPNSRKHEAVLPVRFYNVLCKDVFNNEESITVYP